MRGDCGDMKPSTKKASPTIVIAALACAGAVVASAPGHADAPPTVLSPIEKTVQAGTATRLAFARDLNPDCSFRAIPTIRVLTQPAHGTAVIKTVEDLGGFYAGVPVDLRCMQTKAIGASLEYVANAGYTGPDTLRYEVLSNGMDAVTPVNLTVK